MIDLDDIRTMNDLRPAGYWKMRIEELCARVEALEAALRPFAEQNYSDLDALLTARRLLGLPEFPSPAEALAQLRELVGSHFDGVDPVAYVAELRGDDEGAIVAVARAWAGAVENCDGIVAAEQELLRAIKACS
jgi:hypothetical protein